MASNPIDMTAEQLVNEVLRLRAALSAPPTAAVAAQVSEGKVIFVGFDKNSEQRLFGMRETAERHCIGEIVEYVERRAQPQQVDDAMIRRFVDAVGSPYSFDMPPPRVIRTALEAALQVKPS